MTIIRDPETYERMSRPFDTIEDANETLNKFFAECRELRIKHGLRDVHVSVLDSVLDPDGGEAREVFVDMHIGASKFVLPMAHAALGAAKHSHAEQMAGFERLGQLTAAGNEPPK